MAIRPDPAGLARRLRRWLRPLRIGAVNGLSALGGRWGFDWLVYHPFLFLYYDRRARKSAPAVMRTFARVFPEVRHLADVGAGSGAFAAEAQRRGWRVEACEHSRFGRWLARRRKVQVRPFDLTATPPTPLVGPFDLAYCFEVAEHVEPPLGDRLVAYLASLAPTVVFTAARPGQGGTGHVNEQPRSYWIPRFEGVGMRLRADLSDTLAAGFRAGGVSAWWLCENVMVFERVAPGRSYEDAAAAP